METVSPEEIRRVHRWECGFQGHSYHFIHSFQVDGPVRLTCSHCGKGWQVSAEKEDDAPSEAPKTEGDRGYEAASQSATSDVPRRDS